MSQKKFNVIERACRLGPADLLRALPVQGEIEDWEEVLGGDRASVHAKLGNATPLLESENLKEHVTLGIVGSPNVGKSSVMNRLIGKKVTRTSITPGATKYRERWWV